MLLENPIVLGAIAFVLVFVIRKLAWPVDGIKALWLTMGVALVLAIAERLVSGGIPGLIPCALEDPVATLNCIAANLGAIVAEAGVIFASAEVIYKVLRTEVKGRSILGDTI